MNPSKDWNAELEAAHFLAILKPEQAVFRAYLDIIWNTFMQVDMQ